MPILLASLIVLGAVAGPPPLEPLGRFDARAIPEASGIVKSRRFPGIFWVHNDSGNAPRLFAVRSDGRIVRRFRLAIPNLDWEDIAIDDQGHLYLGDIGNNTGLLRVRAIYRIDEPDPSSPEDRGPSAGRHAAVSYVLPRSNRFDAEGLVYDQGTAILVAKYLDGREAELFAVPIDPPSPPPTGPSRSRSARSAGCPASSSPPPAPSLSEDGTLLAVCSYAVTRVYRRGESPRLAAPGRGPVRGRLPIEGITWDGRDLILAAEEGRGLYRLSEATWRAAGRRETARDRADASAEGEMMAETSDVVIVGGGVIGLSIAYALAREGSGPRCWTAASWAARPPGPAPG